MKVSNKEVESINKYFKLFFDKFDFKLDSFSSVNVLYSNKTYDLTFLFSVRYIVDFEGIKLTNKETGNTFLLRHLIEKHFNKPYNVILEEFTGKSGNRIRTNLEAYSIIVEEHLNYIFKKSNYSWEEDLKKGLARGQ
ncbi:hypothetical protein [Aquimarina algiphila]|uniref:hypothetical protein n=1 Tax=Aquimarina algiphila TaxID=2047982 RepID=UPI00233149A2|nr:hypothetical protein [Aquimarina algiphila]